MIACVSGVLQGGKGVLAPSTGVSAFNEDECEVG